jgi:hypothetical protein
VIDHVGCIQIVIVNARRSNFVTVSSLFSFLSYHHHYIAMPLISPAEAPPTAKISSMTAEPSSKSSSSSITNGHSKSTPTKVGRSPKAGKDLKQAEEKTDGITSRIPKVQLDIDVITDSIAAKLATSFLGHILFLKGQVPL